MTPSKQSIGALIASRICHDLISPVGAITNGLELMEMAGTVGGEEMKLVAESVENASARIRFFRIAFGMATADQMVPNAEVTTILRDITKGGRNSIEWQATGDLQRKEIQAVFQAILCLETGLAMGGAITITNANNTWRITGQGPKIIHTPDLWARLIGKGNGELTPAQVQFALLPDTLNQLDRSVDVEVSPDAITIGF